MSCHQHHQHHHPYQHSEVHLNSSNSNNSAANNNNGNGSSSGGNNPINSNVSSKQLLLQQQHQHNGDEAENYDENILSNEYSTGEPDESCSLGGEERHEDASDIMVHKKLTYLVEHLATFTVNKNSGIVTPADGMRRLLQLEKTTGIWSQKMQLCLDHRWILIIDYETGVGTTQIFSILIKEISFILLLSHSLWLFLSFYTAIS